MVQGMADIAIIGLRILLSFYQDFPKIVYLDFRLQQRNHIPI